MNQSILESDWKLFQKLRPIVLNRFCQTVIDEIAQIAANSAMTPHERYSKICGVIQEHDRTIAAVFNGSSRSTAQFQLSLMYGHGLISEEEISQFGQVTREFFARLAALRESP